jgi:hypothetical protein
MEKAHRHTLPIAKKVKNHAMEKPLNQHNYASLCVINQVKVRTWDGQFIIIENENP